MKYPPDTDARVAALIAEGVPPKEICDRLNIPLARMRKAQRNTGAKYDKSIRSAMASRSNEKRGRVYEADVVDKIAKLRSAGHTRREIAEELHISIDKVHFEAQKMTRLTKEQVSQAHSTYSEEQRQQVLERRLKGELLEEIVDSTGVSLGSVRAFLSRASVKLTPEQRRLNSGVRKHSLEVEDAICEVRLGGVDRKQVAQSLHVPLSKVKSVLVQRRITLDQEAKMRNVLSGRAPYLKRYASSLPNLAALHGGSFVGAYTHSRTKTGWRCAEGHEFEMRPNDVQQGQWCPVCAGVGPSAGQLELFEFVRSLDDSAILGDRVAIKPLELDILVPGVLGLEYNGLIWHSSLFSKRGRHARKFRACQEAGIPLFAVYEDEWSTKRELIEKMVAHRLGKSAAKRLGARKCRLERLEHMRDYNPFFEDNHLDGGVPAEYAWGLYHEGILVCCASFRINFAGERELARLANHRDYHVIGGASRLIRQCAEPLVSFSNNRLSRGAVYEDLGFQKVSENRPSYWYTDGRTRTWRWKCRRNNDPAVLAVHATEEEQARAGVFSQGLFGDDRPLYRIEDYGHIKWLRPNL